MDSEPAKAMGCQVGGGGAKPAFDCNAALGNFARLQKTRCTVKDWKTFNNLPAEHVFIINMMLLMYLPSWNALVFRGNPLF